MDFSKINLDDHQELARKIILAAAGVEFKRRSDFEKLRNRVVKENKGVIFHNLYLIKAYNDLLFEGKIEENPSLRAMIVKRGVRTMSGVAPVTVMTKPWPCPGRCVYCPTDARMPKSYLPSQPAAQRAFRQRFNPYTQVFVRLKAMMMTGHEISKVELRVIGGTWSAYPRRYQRWFLKQCLFAMNEFPQQIKLGRGLDMSKLTKKEIVKSPYGEDEVNTVHLAPLKGKQSWDRVVKANETAPQGGVRCIGINIETRPDQIDRGEVRRLRDLGVTKVEMGVQTVDDEVQKITRRGHTVEQVKVATRLLKNAGFKVGYHMMPNLPGSTPARDKKMVEELFIDSDFQPDYLKIYPCVVVPKSVLASWYRKGDYKPYSQRVLEDVLAENMKNVPEWCRIDRIARDIPSDELEAGFKSSNVRQILEERLKKEGTPVRDIRAREVGDTKVGEVCLVEREYAASDGAEWFLSYEDLKQDKLLGLLRLRFPEKVFIDELKGAALVREVHVYGKQVSVGDKGGLRKQHSGLGKKLMDAAEARARLHGYKKVAVISGIGTRAYYRMLGYRLKGTYMVKSI